MVIIDNIKDPAPIFTRIPHPETFKTTLDKQKYWAEQKRRWHEGYSEDVNGMLYFYAQECMLKNRITGEKYYPTVRDADVIITKEFESAMKNGEAMFFIKPRGIGFSSFGMNLPFYFSRIYPDSKSIATSKDKTTLAELFTQKTMVCYDEMHSMLKPDLLNKNQTKNDAYIKVGYKYFNKHGEEKYAESDFSFRDTQESDKAATAFSGYGAIYGFADEAPLMPRLMTFFGSAIECFTDHSINKIVGGLLMGGTAENTLTPEDIKRIQNIWDNSKALRIRTLFLPATYGKHVVNGHSNHERAREEILKRRDELSNLDDKKSLNDYIKNNPLDISEIFNYGQGGMFDEDTVEKVNAQLRYLPKIKDMPKAHKIIITGPHVEAQPVSESPLEILEHPKENVDYIMGVDGIGTSQLTSSENNNSKYAAAVMKGVDPQSDLQFAPIALFMERPKTIERAIIQAVNLAKYYNKYGRLKVMAELNQGTESLLTALQNAGMSSCIMMRKDLSKKGWVDTKKPWFYRAEAILNWQIENANTYFKKYSQMVRFKQMLIDATKGIEDNKDALDALEAALYGWGTGDLLSGNIKEKKVKTIKLLRYIRNENGVMVPEWYEKDVVGS